MRNTVPERLPLSLRVTRYNCLNCREPIGPQGYQAETRGGLNRPSGSAEAAVSSKGDRNRFALNTCLDKSKTSCGATDGKQAMWQHPSVDLCFELPVSPAPFADA